MLYALYYAIFKELSHRFVHKEKLEKIFKII